MNEYQSIIKNLSDTELISLRDEIYAEGKLALQWAEWLYAEGLMERSFQAAVEVHDHLAAVYQLVQDEIENRTNQIYAAMYWATEAA